MNIYRRFLGVIGIVMVVLLIFEVASNSGTDSEEQTFLLLCMISPFLFSWMVTTSFRKVLMIGDKEISNTVNTIAIGSWLVTAWSFGIMTSASYPDWGFIEVFFGGPSVMIGVFYGLPLIDIIDVVAQHLE